MFLLARASADDLIGPVLLWSGVIIAFGLAGLAVVLLIRRSLVSGTRHAQTFTLQDLRDMLAAGTIDQQEFDTMRAALLGRHVRRGRAAEGGRDGRAGSDPDNTSTA